MTAFSFSDSTFSEALSRSSSNLLTALSFRDATFSEAFSFSSSNLLTAFSFRDATFSEALSRSSSNLLTAFSFSSSALLLTFSAISWNFSEAFSFKSERNPMTPSIAPPIVSLIAPHALPAHAHISSQFLYNATPAATKAVITPITANTGAPIEAMAGISVVPMKEAAVLNSPNNFVAPVTRPPPILMILLIPPESLLPIFRMLPTPLTSLPPTETMLPITEIPFPKIVSNGPAAAAKRPILIISPFVPSSSPAIQSHTAESHSTPCFRYGMTSSTNWMNSASTWDFSKVIWPFRLSFMVSAISLAAPSEESIAAARLLKSSSLALMTASIPDMASFPNRVAAA